MREKAKELQRQRMETAKRGGPAANTSGGYGSDSARNSGGGGYSGISVDTPAEPPKPTFSSAP